MSDKLSPRSERRVVYLGMRSYVLPVSAQFIECTVQGRAGLRRCGLTLPSALTFLFTVRARLGVVASAVELLISIYWVRVLAEEGKAVSFRIRKLLTLRDAFMDNHSNAEDEFFGVWLLQRRCDVNGRRGVRPAPYICDGWLVRSRLAIWTPLRGRSYTNWQAKV